MMSNGLLFHLVIVNYIYLCIPSIDLVLVESEFQDVFPDVLHEVPPLERLTLVSL